MKRFNCFQLTWRTCHYGTKLQFCFIARLRGSSKKSAWDKMSRSRVQRKKVCTTNSSSWVAEFIMTLRWQIDQMKVNYDDSIVNQRKPSYSVLLHSTGQNWFATRWSLNERATSLGVYFLDLEFLKVNAYSQFLTFLSRELFHWHT